MLAWPLSLFFLDSCPSICRVNDSENGQHDMTGLHSVPLGLFGDDGVGRDHLRPDIFVHFVGNERTNLAGGGFGFHHTLRN